MRGHQHQRPAPRLWTAALGGESVYEVDLPGCCQRDARAARSNDEFECPECGAMWAVVGAEDPEVCQFTVEARQDRLGAA